MMMNVLTNRNEIKVDIRKKYSNVILSQYETTYGGYGIRILKGNDEDNSS